MGIRKRAALNLNIKPSYAKDGLFSWRAIQRISAILLKKTDKLNIPRRKTEKEKRGWRRTSNAIKPIANANARNIALEKLLAAPK